MWFLRLTSIVSMITSIPVDPRIFIPLIPNPPDLYTQTVHCASSSLIHPLVASAQHVLVHADRVHIIRKLEAYVNL